MNKPWDNEKTPATDAIINDPCKQIPALCDHARDWERRARHAEGLLARAYSEGIDYITWELLQEINAHDDAAAREDSK